MKKGKETHTKSIIPAVRSDEARLFQKSHAPCFPVTFRIAGDACGRIDHSPERKQAERGDKGHESREMRGEGVKPLRDI